MKKIYITSLVMLLAIIGLTSCDNFLDITPTGKVIAKTGVSCPAHL